jgi:sulfopyruvate decarboxylase TPP-binding subunit
MHRASEVATLLLLEFDWLVTVPDSRTAEVLRQAEVKAPDRVVQVVDESTAIGIACGLTLGGRTALVIMESSGLRRGFETLARLSASHGIHPAILATDRGALGDPDWWAASHYATSRHVTAAVNALCVDITEQLALDDFREVLTRMKRHLMSQQAPVVAWLHPLSVENSLGAINE